MILTSQEQWVELYAAIREESRTSEERHVFIYASSADTDALCALRILEVRAHIAPAARQSPGGA